MFQIVLDQVNQIGQFIVENPVFSGTATIATICASIAQVWRTYFRKREEGGNSDTCPNG